MEFSDFSGHRWRSADVPAKLLRSVRREGRWATFLKKLKGIFMISFKMLRFMYGIIQGFT